MITGGSSRLGNAIAHQALQEDAQVFVTYFRHPDSVRNLTEKGATAFELDLSDMRAIEVLTKQIKEKIKRLDILIHNAAAVRDATIGNLTEEDWDFVLTANLKAPYYLTKKLLPLLFKADKSKIFFITSRVALKGGFGASNYAASKAGIIGLVKSLAQELGRKQILVNAINPGFMKSAMTEALPAQVIEANLSASPLGRFSEPEEVARFLTFLGADQTTQVTGQVIHFESRNI